MDQLPALNYAIRCCYSFGSQISHLGDPVAMDTSSSIQSRGAWKLGNQYTRPLRKCFSISIPSVPSGSSQDLPMENLQNMVRHFSQCMFLTEVIHHPRHPMETNKTCPLTIQLCPMCLEDIQDYNMMRKVPPLLIRLEASSIQLHREKGE